MNKFIKILLNILILEYIKSVLCFINNSSIYLIKLTNLFIYLINLFNPERAGTLGPLGPSGRALRIK